MVIVLIALKLSIFAEVFHISCNIGTRDLPETYMRSPRAWPYISLLVSMLQLLKIYYVDIKIYDTCEHRR